MLGRVCSALIIGCPVRAVPEWSRADRQPDGPPVEGRPSRVPSEPDNEQRYSSCARPEANPRGVNRHRRRWCHGFGGPQSRTPATATRCRPIGGQSRPHGRRASDGDRQPIHRRFRRRDSLSPLSPNRSGGPKNGMRSRDARGTRRYRCPATEHRWRALELRRTALWGGLRAIAAAAGYRSLSPQLLAIATRFTSSASPRTSSTASPTRRARRCIRCCRTRHPCPAVTVQRTRLIACRCGQRQLIAR